jgi:hypothetical protein
MIFIILFFYIQYIQIICFPIIIYLLLFYFIIIIFFNWKNYKINYKKKSAVHCAEELILLMPENAHYHSKLADAYYSIGFIIIIIIIIYFNFFFHYFQKNVLSLMNLKLRYILYFVSKSLYNACFFIFCKFCFNNTEYSFIFATKFLET